MFRSCPEEDITVLGPYGFHLANLLRGLVGDERHLRLKSRESPVVVAQRCAILAYIVHSRLGIPEHSPLHGRQLLMQPHLGSKLMGVKILGVRIFYRTLHILTDNKRTVGGILAPPFDEGLIVGCLMTNLPI